MLRDVEEITSELSGRPEVVFVVRQGRYRVCSDGTIDEVTPGSGGAADVARARRGSTSEAHRVRRECTDRLLIVGRRHLEAVLTEYVHHYDTHRPHRALQQRPPDAPPELAPPVDNARVLRRDRLGGVIHEYAQVA